MPQQSSALLSSLGSQCEQAWGSWKHPLKFSCLVFFLFFSTDTLHILLFFCLSGDGNGNIFNLLNGAVSQLKCGTHIYIYIYIHIQLSMGYACICVSVCHVKRKTTAGILIILMRGFLSYECAVHIYFVACFLSLFIFLLLSCCCNMKYVPLIRQAVPLIIDNSQQQRLSLEQEKKGKGKGERKGSRLLRVQIQMIYGRQWLW